MLTVDQVVLPPVKLEARCSVMHVGHGPPRDLVGAGPGGVPADGFRGGAGNAEALYSRDRTRSVAWIEGVPRWGRQRLCPEAADVGTQRAFRLLAQGVEEPALTPQDSRHSMTASMWKAVPAGGCHMSGATVSRASLLQRSEKKLLACCQSVCPQHRLHQQGRPAEKVLHRSVMTSGGDQAQVGA